jgi:SPP1 gp7 family putative phage head morphogenesis protein
MSDFYSDLKQKRSGSVTKYRHRWHEVLSTVAEASIEAYVSAGDEQTGRAKALTALRNHRDDYRPVLEENTIDVASVWGGEVLAHLKSQRQVPEGEGAGKQAAVQHLADEGADLVQDIHESTKNTLRSILQETMDEDLSEGEKIRRMREQWEGLSRVRARRIARTETVRASSIGVEAAGQDAPFGVEYEWMAANDSRTRAAHLAADGNKRTPDGFFEIGGHEAKHPADMRLPPSQSVNCRCAMAAVPDL